MLLVRIHIPSEDRTKTVKVKADEPVADVIDHIHLATKIAYETSNPYALYFPGPPAGRLDHEATLPSLGVKKLDTLEFRRDPTVSYRRDRRRRSTPTMDALLLDDAISPVKSPRVPLRKDRTTSAIPGSSGSSGHRRSGSIGSPGSSVSGTSQAVCETMDISMLAKRASTSREMSREAAHVSLSTRLLFVEMPDTQTRRGLKVPVDNTLEDLLLAFTKKTSVPNLGDYCLFVFQDDPSVKTGKRKVKLDRRKVVKTLADKTTLLLERTQVKVVIRFQDKETELILVEKPKITVSELAERVCKLGTRKADLANVVDKPRKYCFFLPNKSGTGGTALLPSRSLESYRMTEGDFLLWTPKSSVKQGLGDISKKTQAGELFIVVELQLEEKALKNSSNPKATLKVKNGMTIGDVMGMFLKKHKVEHSSQYALFLEEKGKRGACVQLDTLKRVGDYSEQLSNLCKLSLRKMQRDEFRKKEIPVDLFASRPSLSKDLGPDFPFGGHCITSDKLVSDRGFMIPSQLARLREAFDALNGTDSEGIFRLAGDEDYMYVLREHFGCHENGCDCKVDSVDDVATLLKRWMASLPKKIFGELISGELFSACKRGEELALRQIPEALPPRYKDIFLWLTDLLVEVARNAPVNKMTTKNLAVVMSPALAYSPPDNPVLGLQMTGYAVAVFQQYLKLMCS